MIIFPQQSYQADQQIQIASRPSNKRVCLSSQDESSDFQAAPLTIAINSSMMSIQRDDDDNFISLGWGDFPVVMQDEAHPSIISSQRRKAFSPIRNCEVGVAAQEAPVQIVSPQQILHKRKEPPSADEDIVLEVTTTAFTSFGWSDFPLLVVDGSQPQVVDDDDDDEMVSAGECCDEHVEESVTQQHCVVIADPQPPQQGDDGVVTSFGWSDFPLIGHDTTCFPSVAHIISDDTTITARTQQASASTRAVQFSSVHIREYSIQLGDHPLCSSYPLSLDWTYEDSPTEFTVDEYEQARAKCCWDTKPQRIDVMERRARIAHVMGISTAEVDVMERYRREQDEGAVGPKATAESLTRVPTIHIFPNNNERQVSRLNSSLLL
jgi:hypothetical protein